MREPKFVRRSVSGAAPILKYHEASSPLLLNSVTVRHVPFTDIESPSWQSESIDEHEPIVREVPPPPELVESRELSSVTAVVRLSDYLSYGSCDSKSLRAA